MISALRTLGYRTGMWGKWHSGTTEGYLPWQRGFDEAFVADLYQHRNAAGRHNGQPVQHQRWSDEVIVDHAIDFIERAGDSPFFAYLPFLTCHSPLDAPEEIVAQFEQRGLSHNLATLYAMVTLMDREIGRLIDFLRQSGRLENTIVLFLSDNGPATLAGTLDSTDHAIRNTVGWKGFKGNLWENGIRSPLYVLGGGLSHAHVARFSDVSDLFPTLVELAGGDPTRVTRQPLHGCSLAPLLRDPNARLPERQVFYYAHPAWAAHGEAWTPAGRLDEYEPVQAHAIDPFSGRFALAVRNDTRMLIFNPDRYFIGETTLSNDGTVLFDTGKDPRQLHNLGTGDAAHAPLWAALQVWARESWADAKTLSAPVFVLSGVATSKINAYGLFRHDGSLVNAATSLRNLARPGSWADYHVRVKVAGRYRVTLADLRQPPAGARFVVQVGATRVTGVASASGPLVFPPLALPVGDHTLRLQYDGPNVFDPPLELHAFDVQRLP